MTNETKKKSIKLSNDLRDKILKKILGNAFDEREEAMKQRRFAFSDKVYNDIYSEEVRKQMNELPDGWLPKTSYLQVQFGYGGSGYCQRSFKEDKLILSKHEGGCVKSYEVEHPLTIEHTDLTNDFENLKTEKTTALHEIRAIINSCTTTGALKTTWPEIAAIVELYEPSVAGMASTALVPVLNDLNKKLGL